MKIAINGLLERIRNQYDRVLAFVAVSGLVATLIAIVIQFGAIRQSNEKFAREMRDLRPEREHVDTVADAAVLLVRQTLATPPELLVGEARTGWFFVPESRFSCAECGHPVPVASEDCPFCGALVTPPVPEEADHDGDGMPTLWEQQYGLDPHDPSDAHEDLDGDGFTNLEEFHYGTDPTDPQSHPPLIDWLIVDNVESQRFALQFRSRMRTPTGFRFGINYTLPNGSVKTDFVDIGDQVEGFTIVSYEEKMVQAEPPRMVREDRSELTLRSPRGDNIVLVLDQPVPHVDQIAHLRMGRAVPAHQFSVGPNDTFNLDGISYRVINIDASRSHMILKPVPEGASYTVTPEVRATPVVPELDADEGAPVGVQETDNTEFEEMDLFLR